MTLKTRTAGLLHSLQAAVLVVLASTAAASAEQAEYMGAGAIHSPYNCSWPTGVEMTRARYIPAEISDGDVSIVTLNFAVGGVNIYNFRGGLSQRRSWRRGMGRSIWGALYFMGTRPSARVLARQEAVYNSTADVGASDNIRLRMRIRNFNGEAGCGVTVSLMLRHLD